MHHNLKSCDYTYFFTIISKAKWPFSSQSDNVVFYREEWTKGRKGPGRKIRGSSRPPTEVCSNLRKKNKAIRKKLTLMPRGLLRDLQV